MAQLSLTLASARPAEESAARWFGPILAHWPRGLPPPRTEVGTPEAVLAPWPRRWGGTLLLVLGPGTPPELLRVAVESLRDRQRSAVVLVPGGEGAPRALSMDGVIVESWDADPALVAGMLYALAEQQAAVTRLARELHLENVSHGSLRGEMSRLRDELELASNMQRELLPRSLPAPEGLSLAALFRPAAQVSGDIYDARMLGDGTVGFFIADAVGHGVPAALLTMQLSRAMAALEARDGRGPDPGAALVRLNEELCAQQHERAWFATAVAGVIDPRTHAVRLAGAGHPPPLRVGLDFCEWIETEGPLLGIFPDALFTEARFVLEPGQTLLLYTDGLELAFPGRGGPGASRRTATREYIRHLDGLTRRASDEHSGPALIMERLAGLIDAQEGSLHQRDDVTALAISRPGLAAGARAA